MSQVLLDTDHQAILGRSRFLHGLTESQRAKVLAAGRPRQVAAGATLFRQGEPATRFYIVVEGRARLTQLSVDGNQVIIGYAGPGEGLGIIVALSGMEYPLSAEAVEDVLAHAWDATNTKDLMQRIPQLAVNGMEMIARRFIRLQDQFRELSTERVERRVARTLLRLVRTFGRRLEVGVLIDMPLSRQDLAEMTGTNLYYVSRILSGWEQKGFVKLARKRVVLLKAHELVVIAEDLASPDS